MSNPLKGKVVAFTGRLTRVRRVARKELEDAGGYFSSTVSARVDILVAGGDTGNKLDDAERMGIEVWDEADFDNALNGVPPKKKKRNRNRSRSRSRSPGRKRPKRQLKKRKKKRKKDDRPVCKYGKDCYQTGGDHRRKFYHPHKDLNEFSSDDDDDGNNNNNNNVAGNDDNKDNDNKIDVDDNDNDDDDNDIVIHDDQSESKDIEIDKEAELHSDDDDADEERRNILEIMWEAKFDILSGTPLKDIPSKFVGRMKGQSIAFTGWTPICRRDLIQIIKKCGGNVRSKVDNETQMLICGERPGLKLFEAQEHGIPIIMYPEIGQMLKIYD